MNKLTLVLFIALLLISGFCGPVQAEESASLPDPGIKNVIFIILDALRADHLGVYGYERNTSPNIDRLAAKGVVFDRAVAQAGWTKPSVASYFTSLHPNVHRVLHYEECFPDTPVTLADIFRRNGYYTYGFVNNVHITPELGFGKGFDVYRKMLDEDIINNLWLVLTGHYINPEQLDEMTVDRIRRFLRENPDRNLVKNGGFESFREEWSGNPAWIQKDITNSSRYAVHLDKALWPGSNFYHVFQEVTLEDGEDYLFGAFVRTQNLKEEVGIGLYEPGSRKKQYASTEKLTGTNDWTLLLAKYRPQTCDAHNLTPVQIRAGRVTDFQEGEFWVDDVFIIPVNELPSLRPADRLFIYCHLIDPHAPYLPPPMYLNLFSPKEGASLIDKYDGEIRSKDAQLGLLFEGLDALGILDQNLIVITSDHGEAFGEHGQWMHGAKYYHEEVSRVPLIFYNPGLFPRAARRRDPVESSVDLLPSLVDLLGLSVPAGTVFQGQSYFAPPGTAPRLASCYETPYNKVFSDDYAYPKTITDGSWKYITNRYCARVGDFDVQGEWCPDTGVEVTIKSPAGEETIYFPAGTELGKSESYTRLDEGIRSAVRSVYLAASEGKTASLFNLAEDPGEKNNLIRSYPEKAAELQLLLEERIAADHSLQSRTGAAPAKKVELGEDIKKELRALGYLN